MRWPTREAWAKQRQTAHAGDSDYPHASRRVSDYGALPSDILDRLKVLWKDYGRQMRATAVDAERERIKSKRRFVNVAMKDIRADTIPGWYVPSIGDEARSIIAPLLERQKAAQEAAVATWVTEKAKTPIDDEAWQRELERRQHIEDWEVNRYIIQ
jgi:hypothetical protein